MQSQCLLISYLLFIFNNAETSYAQQSQQASIIDELQEQLTTCNTQVRTLESNLKSAHESNNNSKIIQHKLLTNTEKKMKQYKLLYEQCKLEDDNIRVKRETEQERLSECIQAVTRLLKGQENLTELLEERSNELRKECSKPKLCFNEFAVMLSNGAHFFNAESMTWPDAREFCRSKGMDLVAIESISENKAIASHGRALGAPFTSMNAWTSGCYISDRGDWVWHSTNQSLTYKNWWKTHGTNTVNDTCIVLDSSDTTFLTGNKTEPRPFICEL